MIVKLSSYGIKDAISKINFLKDNIALASKEIIEELVNSGKNTAEALNNSAPHSGTEPSIVLGKITENGNKGYIALTGDSAVYDEFGTGEEGASDPHPLKDNFGLNPYNSGPTIFYNQFANRYQWRYYPMRGKPYYTESGLTSGIPSGKQMYNTSKYIREIKDDVIKHKIQEALQKYKD